MKYAKTTILSALLFAAVPTWAATYTVGVENNRYMPYYSYENGEYQGYAADVLRKFAKDTGIELKFVARPITRLYSEFFKGKFDFKFPDNPVWAKNKKKGHNITYSVGVAPFIDGTMIRKTDAGKYASAESVQKLGIIRGFSPWDWMPYINKKAVKLDQNKNFSLLVTKIISGKVNAIYANIDVVKYTLRVDLKQKEALVYDSNLPYSKGEYMLSTISHPAVVEKFNTWFNSNQDYIKGLKQKYGIGD